MKPLISYYGGKQRLVQWIISHFPQHKTYVEPFAGGAAVFFAKDLAEANVLNDTNAMLINLYKQAQDNPEELFDMINTTPHSRREYMNAAMMLRDIIEANEISKGWAMYIATMQAFLHNVDRMNAWAYEKQNMSKSADSTRNKKTSIQYAIKKLKSATIENIDAINCIEKYDSNDTLFYIDPPYLGTDQGHYDGYTKKDFENLFQLLHKIKGKFFLSHYESDYLINTKFNVYRKETHCGASSGKHGSGDKNKRVELLITNTTLNPKNGTLFEWIN